jgi:hypothetical protein
MAKAKAKTKAVSNQPAKAILSWKASEFVEYKRSTVWYVLIVLGGLLLVAGSLLFKQWLMAGVFAMTTIVVLSFANAKPRKTVATISTKGIQVGGDFHVFSKLKTYWMYGPPNTLVFQPTGRFKPLVRIHLEKTDPQAVRNALKPYLSETPKRGADLADKFSHLIRL